MLLVHQSLALRFEKIKEAYAQANTSQEKLGLLKVSGNSSASAGTAGPSRF